ncbi:MAG: DUF4012 domain-containing protein [bacterium]|nr:DUF4012 domain-containing protein [bacterium]
MPHKFFTVKTFFLAIVSLCVVSLIIGGWIMSGALLSLYDHLASARTNVLSGDINFARGDLDDARKALKTVSGGVRLFSFMRALPLLRENIVALERIVSSGDALIAAANQTLGVSNDLIHVVYIPKGAPVATISPAEKKKIVHEFFRQLPTLVGVNANVSLALSSLSSLDHDHLLWPIDAVRREMLDKGGSLERMLSLLTPFMEEGPSVAGFSGEKTYLFLLQNNTETRATGGFIGTYGVLKVRDADIVSVRTDNVYNLDDHAPANFRVAPPEPFTRYFPPKERWWYLRDSNWSPDFSDAAQTAEWFYAQEGGKEHFDGVIAITPDVIASFLTLVGPIDASGVRFTSQNFVDQLEYQVEQGYNRRGIPEHQRKEMVGEVMRKIIDRLYTIRTDQVKSFFDLAKKNLDEKHILLYFSDPAAQQFAHDSHWSGEISDAPGDSLMVVDSNMGSMKTDPVVKKQIQYKMEEQKNGKLIARTTLSYQNTGRYSWKTTDYRDYVRIYVPEGAVLIAVTGAQEREGQPSTSAIDTTSEHGKVSFGAYLMVPVGQTREITFEYELPKRISDQVAGGLYTFLIQKQSGISQQQFDGSFAFQKPMKSSPSLSNELVTTAASNRAALQTTLFIDQSFALHF